MKTATILIGLPGSGKSTYAARHLTPDTFIYSTDDIIEKKAVAAKTTYNAVFADAIGDAIKEADKLLADAVKERRPIIWDQTNQSRGKRAKIFSKFENEPYTLTAICFEIKDEELWQSRLDARADFKLITPDIIAGLSERFEEPSLDEGFDHIVFVDQNGNILRELKGDGRKLRADRLQQLADERNEAIAAVVADIDTELLADAWFDLFNQKHGEGDLLPDREIGNWLRHATPIMQEKTQKSAYNNGVDWTDIKKAVADRLLEFFHSH